MEALIQASLVRCYVGPLLLFYTLECCNNWPCTSLDVEAGSSIRYKKRENKKIKVVLIDRLDIPQSAVALYIYRVGGLIPQVILIIDLNQ